MDNARLNGGAPLLEQATEHLKSSDSKNDEEEEQDHQSVSQQGQR